MQKLNDNREPLRRDQALAFIDSIFQHDSKFHWWFKGMYSNVTWLQWRDVEDSYNKWMPLDTFAENERTRADLVRFLREIANALEPGVKHVSKE